MLLNRNKAGLCRHIVLRNGDGLSKGRPFPIMSGHAQKPVCLGSVGITTHKNRHLIRISPVFIKGTV